MKEDKTERLLRVIMTTDEDEADCDECFEELDRFVEMVQAGEDPAAMLPRIEAHLNHCRCCHEEYEALLAVLHAEGLSEEDN